MEEIFSIQLFVIGSNNKTLRFTTFLFWFFLCLGSYTQWLLEVIHGFMLRDHSGSVRGIPCGAKGGCRVWKQGSPQNLGSAP